MYFYIYTKGVDVISIFFKVWNFAYYAYAYWLKGQIFLILNGHLFYIFPNEQLYIQL